MTNPIITRATQSQNQASDPYVSVWVSASAGSGKTKILIDRIIRLLLNGTPPAQIMCLTFTKAAAGEMTERLMHALKIWQSLDDASLLAKLKNYGLDNTNQQSIILKQARGLFAKILAQPVSMMTIHGLCQSILKRFPIEAGLQPHFKLMDEGESRKLLTRISHALLTGRHGPMSDLFQSLLQFSALSTIENALAHCLTYRWEIQKSIHKNNDLSSTLTHIHNLFDQDPKDTLDNLLDQFKQNTHDFPWSETINAYNTGTAQDQTMAKHLHYWVENPSFEMLSHLKQGLLTQKGAPKKRLMTKKLTDTYPHIYDMICHLQELTHNFVKQLNHWRLARQSKALLALSYYTIDLYDTQKKQTATLDYDDLIEYTLRLLQKPQVAAWVLYRLSGGLSHILIDEAQDTNPGQWAITRYLTEDFGQHPGQKTLFVVGDEKQSIYSFQKANPHLFRDQKTHITNQLNETNQVLHTVPLTVSFRSAPAILRLVDKVFCDQPDGVVADDWKTHQSSRDTAQGKVCLWPLIPLPAPQDPPSWDQTAPTDPPKTGPHIMAEKIADTILGWLLDKRPLSSLNRPVQPDDILILVRKRGTFMQHMIQALKDRDIPTTGLDRFYLQTQQVAADLMAPLRFIQNPYDALNLATLLKGPLIALTEEQIFSLCWEDESINQNNTGKGTSDTDSTDTIAGSTPKTPLWETLQTYIDNTHNIYTPLAKRLVHWQNLCCKTDLSDFLSHILYAEKGWDAITQVFSITSHETITQFCQFIYTHRYDPLRLVIDKFDTQPQAIKRDTQSGTGVRVMTVHGSKGLQAPVVFLPDTTQAPTSHKTEVYFTEDGLPFWLQGKGATPLPPEIAHHVEAYQQDMYHEYKRLLYVALTRAADELYIGGWENYRPSTQLSWYGMIESALSTLTVADDNDNYCLMDAPPLDLKSESRLDLQSSLPSDNSHNKTEPETDKTNEADIRAWLKVSGLLDPINQPQSENSMPTMQQQRGKLIHYLLEHLTDTFWDQSASGDSLIGDSLINDPIITNESKNTPTKQSINASATHNQHINSLTYNQDIDLTKHPKWPRLHDQIHSRFVAFTDPEILSSILAEATQTIQTFRSLWPYPHQCEYTLLDHTQSGRKLMIDRLIFKDEALLVIDYKTDHISPEDMSAPPAAYQHQLRTYARALSAIYPKKPIYKAIIWTHHANLTWVDEPIDDIMDKAISLIA
jgi:ATP-dependent helicase/nuclease subunit A